ncbi:MAG: chromosome segregation protein SMC [Dermatophilaceae bacterium]
MYVKRLTLKGFKSFASATHLWLEPGITCIVGPNGAGKSNVVDALAWVMGEQGAKSLRGGKMEDVIFAGTTGRPALGRAEVSMTIDNTDGALPIDYSEVTIRRTMFRGGGSEYALNGTTCRLVDIQELLSDSGIGREMHVIVGQGQLDAVLRATPEERRGFIEEAAGVLKHRKRKEKALRKLDAMEANLVRVRDLTAEIRRRLGPLGRQAETARRGAVIQADARDARCRLLADDLVRLRAALKQEIADESALVERRDEVESGLGAVRERIAAAEQDVALSAPQLHQAQDRWFALRALADRMVAIDALAAERIRLLNAQAEPPRPARDPDELVAQAAAIRAQERDLSAEIADGQDELAAGVAQRTTAEEAYATERERIARLERAAADRREGLARLAGQVAAQRSRVEAGQAEIGRLTDSLARAQARGDEAESAFTALESTVTQDEESEEGLDFAYEESVQALEAERGRAEELRAAERSAERDRNSAQARREALELALRRKDGTRALLGKEGDAPAAGITGSLAEVLTVRDGYEVAVAAALGWAADALVAQTWTAARLAVEQLRRDDGGHVGLVVPETAQDPGPDPALTDAPGTVWARSVVDCPGEVAVAVDALLARIALVPDAEAAAQVLAAHPGARAVTAEGDVYGPGSVLGGSHSAPSLLEVQAALADARARVEEAAERRDRARLALAASEDATARISARTEAALADLHASDARMNAVAEQLGSLRSQWRTARAEAERTQTSVVAAQESLAAQCATLESVARRLAEAESASGSEPASASASASVRPSTEERDRLEAAAAQARGQETELRLTLRTREERVRSLAGRAQSLEAAARAERSARDQARAARIRRERQSAVAQGVRDAADRAGTHLARVVQSAHDAREAAVVRRAELDAAVAGLRGDADRLAEQLRQLTDSVHRDEVARAEQRLRIEQAQTRSIDELGVDPDVLVAEYGPQQSVPVVPEPGEPEDPQDVRLIPYVRAEQEKRLRAAERGLTRLGKINPLALEEFAALEERHTFLTEQVDDLARSKRDLLDIVKEVDERVERVFGEAFADTAREFEGVFAHLFPGGEGRLVLTAPDDLLTTGIEVEARPAGKRIKRLSLLSGGERSLTAVALLVAIFKARPSPFYIVDEVEAALDDTNLGRLLTLFDELRASSQLIVITHQKRTMEIADALYGVTMRGDGVTTLVSQRIRDVVPAEVRA